MSTNSGNITTSIENVSNGSTNSPQSFIGGGTSSVITSSVPRDKDGNTALHLAAESGSLETAKLLLSMLKERNHSGETPIHIAAKTGHIYLIKLFIEKDPTLALEKDNDGDTPLHWVAAKGMIESSKMLIAAKAEKNVEGFTPLALAVKNGHKAVIELLKEPKEELMEAIADLQTRLDKVKSLINNKK